MQSQAGNVCIRCGKERIVVRTWKEETRGAVLTRTTTACPDSSCQEIVEKEMTARREKKEATERERTIRIAAARQAQKKAREKAS